MIHNDDSSVLSHTPCVTHHKMHRVDNDPCGKRLGLVAANMDRLSSVGEKPIALVLDLNLVSL